MRGHRKDSLERKPGLLLGRRRFLLGAASTATAVGSGLLRFPGWNVGARTAHAGDSDFPPRLVIVSIGHSFQMNRSTYAPWIPTGGPGSIAALPSVMSALEPFRDRMMIVEGLTNHMANLVSDRYTANGHNGNSRTLLSNMPHPEVLAADGSLLPTGPELDYASGTAGPSVDYVVAEQLGALPLVLRVGTMNSEHHRTYRRLAGGAVVRDDGDSNPQVAFDRMFGTTEPAPALSDRERLRQRRSVILQAVADRYRAMSTRVSSEERLHLERHAALVEQTIADLAETTATVCSNPSFAASGISMFDDPLGREENLIVLAQNTLITTALACQATPVASLHYSTIQDNTFPWLNGGSPLFDDGNWHSVVHMDVGTDQVRTMAMAWYMEALSDLLTKLDAQPEGEGSLLDNTLVVFTSSLGDYAHSANNLPVFLFGGAIPPALRGQHRQYPGRSMADLWSTASYLLTGNRAPFGMTGQVSIFGQMEDLATGPLDDFLG